MKRRNPDGGANEPASKKARKGFKRPTLTAKISWKPVKRKKTSFGESSKTREKVETKTDENGKPLKFVSKKFKPPITKDNKKWAGLYGVSLAHLGIQQKKVTGAKHDPEEEGALVLYTPVSSNIGTKKEVHIVVDPKLSKILRDHQRDGIDFVFQCLMGFKQEEHTGCILADEMGLGKTLQSIGVLWTLMCQGTYANRTCENAIIICPASLVKNWTKELKKWLGDAAFRIFEVAGQRRAKVLSIIGNFQRCLGRSHPVLIISYESFRCHAELITSKALGMVICDEGHRLKNPEATITKCVNQLKCSKRLLLTGTPIQNDLDEFYAVVSFVCPEMFESQKHFRRKFSNKIMLGRDAECTDKEQEEGQKLSTELAQMVGRFMLRRDNKVLRSHLPAKVEFVVFVKLQPLQEELYTSFLKSKAIAKLKKGGKDASLVSITTLTKLCNHPSLIYDSCKQKKNAALKSLIPLFPKKFSASTLAPQFSGKMHLVIKLLTSVKELTDDKVVIVSNYTQTIDMISRTLTKFKFSNFKLDGRIPTSKRQKMVDTFNDTPTYMVMLLSSKAGGCGLNLIGANRLIMFDPDWNPANDLQAMARVWRSGQKKKVSIYRLISTGTIEEKMFQRQIFKTDTADMVMTTEGTETVQEGDFALNELKDIFSYSCDTLCDTQDKTRGGFAEWKRNKGVNGCDEECLYNAGKGGLVSYLFAKYINCERKFVGSRV